MTWSCRSGGSRTSRQLSESAPAAEHDPQRVVWSRTPTWATVTPTRRESRSTARVSPVSAKRRKARAAPGSGAADGTVRSTRSSAWVNFSEARAPSARQTSIRRSSSVAQGYFRRWSSNEACTGRAFATTFSNQARLACRKASADASEACGG